MKCRDILDELALTLGIGIEHFQGSETPEEIRLSVEISTGRAKAFFETAADTILGAFGQSLTLKIGLAGSELIEVSKGNWIRGNQHVIQNFEGIDVDLPLGCSIRINKELLVTATHNMMPHSYKLYYFFYANLKSMLHSGILQLDQILFSGSAQTLIMVGDADIYYKGTMISIIGESQLDQLLNDWRPIGLSQLQRIEECRSIASATLNWIGFQLKQLSPLHLIVQSRGVADKELEEILSKTLLNLLIIFTANRTISSSNKFQATYSSSEKTAVLAWGGDEHQNLDAVLLQRFAVWAFPGNGNERLTLIQSIIAREVSGDNPEGNYLFFSTQQKRLLNEFRWHYRLLMDRKIESHFEDLEKAKALIGDTTKQVAQTIDSMAKGFTEALLATVGVIVLTLLASLIKNETQAVFFSVGMRAYAIYLVLFQVIYRMGNIFHSYSLLSGDTTKRLQTYTKRLGIEQLRDILSSLNRYYQQFRIWFWVTIGVYIVVAIGIWLSGDFLPPYLARLGMVSNNNIQSVVVTATPSAISTVSPLPSTTP